MSNYPPGTSASDPRAPWNQPEGVECEPCHGTGEELDEDGNSTGFPCERCDGEGYVDPPTRAEIAEMKAEHDADVRLSE